MNVRPIESNVYYLPLPTSPASELTTPVSASSPWRRWRHAWWRLRVAVAEIRAILRPRRRSPSLDLAALLDADLEATTPVRRVVRRSPARVIDFEHARLRRLAAAE